MRVPLRASNQGACSRVTLQFALQRPSWPISAEAAPPSAARLLEVLVERRRSAGGHSCESLAAECVLGCVLAGDRRTGVDAGRAPVLEPPTNSRVDHFGAADGRSWDRTPACSLGGLACPTAVQGPCPSPPVSGGGGERAAVLGQGARCISVPQEA
jgi:hypothetical protein